MRTRHLQDERGRVRTVTTIGEGVRVRPRAGEVEVPAERGDLARAVARTARERRHAERSSAALEKRERLRRRARGPGRTAFTLAAIEALIDRGLLDHMPEED